MSLVPKHQLRGGGGGHPFFRYRVGATRMSDSVPDLTKMHEVVVFGAEKLTTPLRINIAKIQQHETPNKKRQIEHNVTSLA